MLTTTSAETIRATLPAVGEAIGEISSLFYRKLFAAHPELQRDLFNRGNQSQGDQQKALAGAVAAFAALQLDPDEERKTAILSRIAHKHASLGITADQYWVVHTHLFEAIVDVLGDAVTPEVAQAWDELYWLMANTLIAMEQELYADAGTEPGDVWRTVQVVERRQQSADAVTFRLSSADATSLPSFRPGQYLSVGVVLPDGARQIRQYSLCGSTSSEDWQITVKRALAGRGALLQADLSPAGEVSNFLYDNVFEGARLQVTTPFGDLTLPEGDGPVLLASAGIGCTPMIGMLDHLAATGDTRTVTVLHADRSLADHAHRAEVDRLVERLPNAKLHRYYEDLGALASLETMRLGLADLSHIPVTPTTHAMLCGPLPFMMSVRATLLERGVPAENVHYEVFGPDSWAPAS